MAFPRVNGMRAMEFGVAGEHREKLNALVIHGQKRATSGLMSEDYDPQGEPLEHVGERLAMLDSAGNHVATLLVTRAELVPFGEVSDEFAIAEGEGDLTGDEYRASYREYWEAIGLTVTDDMLVTTVYFDLVEVL